MAVRDPEATQQRILAAARREFAAKGISGGRVDTIAERAKVNKRMLYHYFSSKQGLFRAILADALSRRTASPPVAPASITDRLAARAEWFRQDPEYVRLLMWEALERGRAEPVEQSDRVEAYAGLVAAVRASQGAGELPADLDADQWALAELALTVFPLAFPQVTEMMTGLRPDSAEFATAQARFLEDLVGHLSRR